MINKSILVLPLLASLCMSELAPVSEYIGEHKYNCGYGAVGISGARVDNKIYTFGGCFPIPFIVDPSDSNYNPYHLGAKIRNNVSNAMQVYDMINDEWSVEPAKTPLPWRRAKLQVVNQDIYAFEASSRPASSQMEFWKYSTNLKEWFQLLDLPFIWHGGLGSCQINGRIYFAGSNDGDYRNIMQIYDTTSQQWEKPVFLNKHLRRIKHMLCGKESIKLVAEETNPLDEDNSIDWFSNHGGPRKRTYGIFSSDYETGITKNNFNVTGHYRVVTSKDECLYLYDVGELNSTIYKLNTTTYENVAMGTIPATLDAPLIIPHQDNQVFLFGGGRLIFLHKEEEHVIEVKTFNHKLFVSERKVNENADAAVDDNSLKLVQQDNK